MTRFVKESKSFSSPASRKLYNYKDHVISKTVHDLNGRKRMNELPPLNRELQPKPKVVLFYKNGDRNFRGHHVTVTPRRFRSFDNLLNELTRITNLPQGVRFIFTPNNGNKVETLDDLQDGKSYVCGEYPRLKKMNYAHAPDGSSRRRTSQKNFIPANNEDNKMRVEPTEKLSTTIRPRVITIVRNSVNRPKKNVKVLLNKRTAQNYDQVLNVVTKTFGTAGCIRKLYSIAGKLIKELVELFNDDEIFIAVGNERFRNGDIPYILESLGYSSNNSKSERSSGKSSANTTPKKNTPQKLTKLKTPPSRGRTNPVKQALPSLKKLPSIKSKSRKSVTPIQSTADVNVDHGDTSPVHVDLDEYPIADDKKLEDVPPAQIHDIPLNKKQPLPSIPPSQTSVTNSDEDDDSSIAESKSISIGTSENTDENDTSEKSSENADLTGKNVVSLADEVENSDVTNVTHIDLSGDTLNQTIDDIDLSESETVVEPEKEENLPQDTSVSPSISDTQTEQETERKRLTSASQSVSDSNNEQETQNNENDRVSPSITVTMNGEENESSSNATSEIEQEKVAKKDIEPETEAIEETVPVVNGIHKKTDSETGESESDETASYVSSTVPPPKDTTEAPQQNGHVSEDETDQNDAELEKIDSNAAERYVDFQLAISSDIENFFDLDETLGDGNFAVVKMAKEKATGTMYALKIIDVSKISGKEDMLKNEILVQRESFHPNLVQLVHDFHSPTEIYLAMELVTGGDLFDLIAEELTLDEDVAARYTRDICSGLDYMHRRNIVHRDIKPENLMVSQSIDGTTSLKLADFGLAQEVTEPLMMICGTPTYVAPEILKETGYGLEVDVWAAGVIIYIMLCGFPPFRSTTRKQSELFDLIESGEFEYLAPYWDDVSEPVKDLINKILVVDVKQRYTCKDILTHAWITQYGLKRNNTLDPMGHTRFEVVSRASRAHSVAKAKRRQSAGNELERGENFSESYTSST